MNYNQVIAAYSQARNEPLITRALIQSNPQAKRELERYSLHVLYWPPNEQPRIPIERGARIRSAGQWRTFYNNLHSPARDQQHA